MISQKQILRNECTKHKNHLTDEEIAFRSDLICDRLIQTLLFQKAKCIALYCATGNEVSTYKLIDNYHLKKNIVLPVIADENMFFYPYTGKENLKKGRFGIVEPISRTLIEPKDVDLFIVPGLAFDYAGNRLGRGKGYYDRFLSDTNKPIIGLCFDFQLIESIPHETHDVKMTFVLTENTTV